MDHLHCILIVEDDDDLRETLGEILRLKGYDVLTAANGQEAIAALRQYGEPCLILLDLMMPVMDGWEFRRAQLEDPGLAQVPVVLLSGADEVAREAVNLAAVGHLTKPVELPQVIDTVQQHC